MALRSRQRPRWRHQAGRQIGVISVQLVPLLEAAGLATAAAVWVASLEGVAQFGGRVVESVFARNLRLITVGRIAIGILPPALIILLAGSHQPAARRRVHSDHGRVAERDHHRPRRASAHALRCRGYGAVLGQIATPVLVVNAASPTVFAWIVERWGWGTGRVSLLGGCAASWLAMELMSRWYKRQRAVAARVDRHAAPVRAARIRGLRHMFRSTPVVGGLRHAGSPA